MVFGEEMRLPVELVTGHVNDKHHSSLPSEYVRTLENSLSELYQLVRDATGNDAVRQKRYYDRNVRETNYEVGDLVRRNQRPILKGIKAKLARKWTGPWIVVKRLSDVLFQIKHAKNTKPVVVHADNIKPYRGNKQYPSTRDPQYTSDSQYTSDQLQRGSVTHRRTSARRRRPNPLKMPRNLPPVSDSKSPAPTAKDFNQSEDEVWMTRRGRVLKRPARFRD